MPQVYAVAARAVYAHEAAQDEQQLEVGARSWLACMRFPASSMLDCILIGACCLNRILGCCNRGFSSGLHPWL